MLTVADSITHYRDHLLHQGYSRATVRMRSSLLRTVEMAVGLKRVTPWVLGEMSDIRGHRPGTRYQYFIVCKGYFAWREKVTGEPSPFAEARVPHQPDYRARPVSAEELHRLLQGAQWPVSGFITLARRAGLRAGEISQVCAEDLEPTLTGHDLRVLGKGGREGRVPAHREVVALMYGRSGEMFPGVGPNRVSQMAGDHLRRCGVHGGIHRLRHTFATELYNQTGDVMVVKEALRHSSLAMTQRYIAPDSARVADAVAAL